MKNLLRITRIMLLGLLIVIVGLVGWALTDALALEAPTSVTNITYPAEDGTTLVGYLAQPSDPATGGLRPAVLMVHEWWGLNHEITEMADILAREGYVVLAPDTYRGRLAGTVPGAIFLRVTAPKDRVDADMQAAFEFLRGQQGVDPNRIAVIGFCYGGGVALRHATKNAQIAATVNLYGDTIDTVQGFGVLLTSGRPFFGVFGELDRQIPLEEVDRFSKTLAQTTIPHEVKIYPGVGHAFVSPTAIEVAGAPQNAWDDIKAFLASALK
jgi:carboxymethylenebutenolidase